jgi:hypothetical protein
MQNNYIFVLIFALLSIIDREIIVTANHQKKDNGG